MTQEPSKHSQPTNWPLWIGLSIVLSIIILAFVGQEIAPRDPLEENVIFRSGDTYEIPPLPAFTVPGFWLGTDQFGRDLLSRLLWAVRPTMIMVSIVALTRLFLGTLIGLGAGWSSRRSGRWLDLLISAALSAPVLMVALGAIALLGAELGLVAFIVGLSINGWAETARLVREQTQAIKTQLYIEAAHALGASSMQILRRHVLRQIGPLIWVLFAFEISSTLMVTAGLGFLGYYIGGDVWIEVGDFVSRRVSGTPELGQMLATSWGTLDQPWAMVLTGTVIFFTILGFNLLGEGLRSLSDPERISRRSPMAVLFTRLGGQVEERLIHPASQALRAHKARTGLAALAMVLTIGGVILWRILAAPAPSPAGSELLRPGENLWPADEYDFYGTNQISALGPAQANLAWSYQETSGFSGGPVVAADGTLYLGAKKGTLLAFHADGSLAWESDVAASPVGAPALDPAGNIFIVNKSGALAAFNSDGSLRWRYLPEGSLQAFTGPVLDLSNNIYYQVRSQGSDRLLAISPQGNLLWSQSVPRGHAETLPRLSPTGRYLYIQQRLFDLEKEGTALEIDTPTQNDPVLKNRGQFITGADGLNYFHAGHTMLQWKLARQNMEIVQSASWNYAAAGILSTSSYPSKAGVTPDHIIWLFYSGQYGKTRIVWLDESGVFLGFGKSEMEYGSIIAFDGQNTMYYCGLLQQSAEQPITCAAQTQGSEAALWEFPLEKARKNVVGGALLPGKLYVVTSDGFLFAITEAR